LGDIDAFTHRTRQILSDEALHKRMSKASRHRAETQFDIGHIVPLYESYYERVCAQVMAQV
jgi:glycosyltransferase involved in cell wall biosynthesis